MSAASRFLVTMCSRSSPFMEPHRVLSNNHMSRKSVKVRTSASPLQYQLYPIQFPPPVSQIPISKTHNDTTTTHATSFFVNCQPHPHILVKMTSPAHHSHFTRQHALCRMQPAADKYCIRTSARRYWRAVVGISSAKQSLERDGV